ncbi:MAG: hypothetical protein U0931_35905 [Vulcanimicrobiota bacterium]
MDLSLVFQGKCSNMGVGNQVPAHPGLLKRVLKNFQMPWTWFKYL